MERETYNQSRQGLDSLNASLQAKLEREAGVKSEMERELRLQTNIRAETESAMKVMERDLMDKENLLSASKKQLDDLKLINLEMYQKLQTAETALKHKVSRLLEIFFFSTFFLFSGIFSNSFNSKNKQRNKIKQQNTLYWTSAKPVSPRSRVLYINQSINQTIEQKPSTHSINQSTYQSRDISSIPNQSISQLTTISKSVFSLSCRGLQVLSFLHRFG